MQSEPQIKRVVAFVDGQNLFFSAKEAFGYHYPNYDVTKLVEKVCSSKGRQLQKIKFYTGIPDITDDKFHNAFWSAKLLAMSRDKIEVFSRSLRYRNKSYVRKDGATETILVGDEKGIDVRLAIDVIRMAHRREYDVALIFSQDQDYSEVADEIRIVSKEQRRWIHIASAYPDSPTMNNRRGINKTEWLKIDRNTYDSCVDAHDYRPKK